MFQQMQSMAQKQVLKLFLPMSAYSLYIYIYIIIILSLHIYVSLPLWSTICYYHAHPTYMYISCIVRLSWDHCTHASRGAEMRVHTHITKRDRHCSIFSLSHILFFYCFFFFLFDFLFLKIAAHCCDVVCLQSRELLLRCQWLHSSLAPCHFMLQSPSPPPPPLFHPFAYDTSRRAVMPSRATPPERENERFPREKRVVVKSKRFPLLYTVGGWAHGCPV